MDDITNEEMEEKTAKSLPDGTSKMPSWLLEMTEYVLLFQTRLYIRDKVIRTVLFFISDIGKLNINYDAKSRVPQAEAFLIDDQHYFKNISSQKEESNL